MNKKTLFVGIGLAFFGFWITVIVAKGQNTWLAQNNWLAPLLFGLALLSIFLAIREWSWFGSWFWRAAGVVIPRPQEITSDQNEDNKEEIRSRGDGLLAEGNELKVQVPKRGAPPGADAIWRRSAGEWETKARSFVAQFMPTDLPRFGAFVNPSQELDDRVYTPLWSEYAVFVARLKMLQNLIEPVQRIRELKDEIEAAKARAAGFDRKLAIWPQAAEFYAMAKEAEGLKRRLQNTLTVSGFPGNEAFAEAMRTPLSNIFPISGDEGLNAKLEKWRLQEDIKELKAKVPGIPGFDIQACEVPNNSSPQEVIALLVRTSNALNAHAAGLLAR